MKANGEAVEVANVQRAKVVVEGIVEEAVVNRKVARGRAAAGRRRGTAFSRSLRSLSRRLGRRRKWCVSRRRVDVGAEVESVWRQSVWRLRNQRRAEEIFIKKKNKKLTRNIFDNLTQVLGVTGGRSHCNWLSVCPQSQLGCVMLFCQAYYDLRRAGGCDGKYAFLAKLVKKQNKKKHQRALI